MDTSKHTMADFSDLIDRQLQGYRGGFSPGERVSGVVIEINDAHIVLDLNAKREGLIERGQSEDDTLASVSVGDEISAYFVAAREGAFILTTRLSDAATDHTIRDAQRDGLPVEGMVTKEVNGGYEIMVGGERAFCPYSQIDLHKKEGELYIDRKFQFLVTEYDPEERNVVLSRRALLEKEREVQAAALWESLAEGQIRPGAVTKLMPFGVFVDLGGAEGLIPLRELDWRRDVKPEDVARVGDSVNVLVMKLDRERNQMTLSLRGTQSNPWESSGLQFRRGECFEGRISRVADFGAFVEIQPGIEGLIPISKLGRGRRLKNAAEAVSVGSTVTVEVADVDMEARRLSLALVDTALRETTRNNVIAPGATVRGVVDGVREFGVFIKLDDKRSGLLHIGETEVGRQNQAASKLAQAFPPGKEVDVVIKTIEGDRISLTLADKAHAEADERQSVANYLSAQKKSASSLGSLGDLFGNLKL